MRLWCLMLVVSGLAGCRLGFDATDTPGACAFGGGIHDETESTGNGRVQLRPGALAGTYTSVICAADGPVPWTSLEVVSATPYGKALTASSEVAYPDGRLDASGLVGLWHLDGPLGPVVEPASIDEALLATAGSVHNADATGMAYVPGEFGQALSCDGIDDYVEIAPLSAWRGFDRTTVQVWARAAYSGPSSQFMRLVSFWTSGDTQGSTFQLSHFPSANLYFMVTAQTVEYGSGRAWMQTAGDWHHIVGVFDGTGIDIYVDGIDVQDRVLVPGPLDDRTGPLFFCQGGSTNPRPIYEFDGSLDEVAIWKRALTADEIHALYARGAARLLIQARACDDAACDGESFVGPDGTASSSYSEAMNLTPAPPMFELAGLPAAPYFQWQAKLTRADLTVEPQLVSVIVANEP